MVLLSIKPTYQGTSRIPGLEFTMSPSHLSTMRPFHLLFFFCPLFFDPEEDIVAAKARKTVSCCWSDRGSGFGPLPVRFLRFFGQDEQPETGLLWTYPYSVV